MFYDAAQAGHATDTGFDCLSVATAGPPQPDGRRLHRQLRRTPDLPVQLGRCHRPQPLHRSGHRHALVGLEVQRRGLLPTGPHLVRGAQQHRDRVLSGQRPHGDLLQQHRRLPVGGHRGGPLHHPGRTGSSTCCSAGASTPRRATRRATPSAATPIGPCTQTDPSPILSSYGSVAGPGGGSWFQDAVGQLLAGLRGLDRRLHQLLVRRRPPAVRDPRRPSAPRAASASRRWGWPTTRESGLLGLGLRRRHLQLRRRQVLRLDRRHAPERAHRGHGAHPRRRGLLAGGLRRRHLHLRRCRSSSARPGPCT